MCTYTEQQKYQIFNFHPPETIETLKTWLHADTSKPMVLTGETKIGRSYVIEAACFQETHNNLPYRVIHVDNGVLDGDIKKAAQFIEKHDIKQQDAKAWKRLVDQMADVADIEMPTLFGFVVVLKLTATLKLFKIFSSFFQEYKVKLPETDARTFIQDAIQFAAKQYNLVFHLQNAEAELDKLLLWQDITQTIDLISLYQSDDESAATKQGRVLLAVSMMPYAPYVGAIGQEKEAIEHIALSPYGEQGLKEILADRFEGNDFTDEFIRLLLWQGKLDDHAMSVFPSQLVNPMVKLFEESILQRIETGWIINKSTGAELNSIFGTSLRVFLEERQATIDKSLKSNVNEFMQLAALCGEWIPQHPLLEMMGIDDSDQQDAILDAIETAFVECKPPLLQDEAYNHPGFSKKAVYCSLYPILNLQYTKHLGVTEKQKKAKALLQQLSGKYSLSNSTFASLYWSIASYANSSTQQEWREKLQWHVNQLTVPFFKQWLEERLRSGWIKPEQLMDQAEKRQISPTEKIYLDAVMGVCEQYYSAHGGYPLTNDLAMSLNNIGLTYGELGDQNKALEYKIRALNIWKTVLPEQHPDLALSLNNVGFAYGQLGDRDKALEYQLQGLNIRKAVLPEQHPDLALSLNNVGLIYSELGDQGKALEYQLQALNIWKAVLPAQHPDLATSLSNVGFIYGELDDQDKALEYELQGLNIRKVVLPEQHPDLATSLNNVGLTYGELDDQDKALEYQIQALDIRKAVLPEQHPSLARSLNDVGFTYGKLGNHNKALEYLMQALNLRKVVLSEQHPDLAFSLNNVGFIYGELGDQDKALEYQIQALNIRKAVLPEYHPDIAWSYKTIGYTHLQKKALKKAKKHTKKALKLIKKSLLDHHPYQNKISNQLADIYEAMDKTEKAAKYRVDD